MWGIFSEWSTGSLKDVLDLSKAVIGLCKDRRRSFGWEAFRAALFLLESKLPCLCERFSPPPLLKPSGDCTKAVARLCDMFERHLCPTPGSLESCSRMEVFFMTHSSRSCKNNLWLFASGATKLLSILITWLRSPGPKSCILICVNLKIGLFVSRIVSHAWSASLRTWS